MKRRKFLLTSGSAVLGSTALHTVSQKPVLGLNFDLTGTQNIQPSDVNSILLSFQNFELVPKYVNHSEATVTIIIEVDEMDSVQRKTTILLENGNPTTKDDIGSILPIAIDGVNTNKETLNGSVKIKVENENLSDSYKQSFTITDNSLQQGLIGWWPLHEWNGQANDLSKNTNHGYTKVTEQGSIGRLGVTGYSFTSNDSGIDIPDNSSLDLTNSVSMTAWIRPRSHSQASRIIEKFQSYAMQVEETHLKMVVYGDGGTRNEARGNINIPLNEWTFCATTWDGEEMVVYVNGDEKGRSTADYSSMDTNSNDLQIGEYQGGGRNFDGIISDVRLYNRKLLSDEVQTIQ